MLKVKVLKTIKLTLFFWLQVLVNACSYFSNDFSNLQAFDEQGNLQVVIENPKGETTNVRYDFKIKDYTEQGRLKQPHPANTGFVPSTFTITEGNTGNFPLDVFVVGKILQKGETVSVKPIAVLKYKIENVLQHKIVVVPTLKELIADPIDNFEEFSLKNVELRQQISDWILHQYENKSIQLLGWYDEEEALMIIKEYQKTI